MKNLKKYVILVVTALSVPFVISKGQIVNAGASSSVAQKKEVLSPKKSCLSPECIREINDIRNELIKILSCASKAPIQNKRATMIIVPFSFVQSSALPSVGFAPGVVVDEAELRRKTETIKKLLGYVPATDEIHVPCAELKVRIMKLISRHSSEPEQQLEILKRFCAPCPSGERLIDGDVEELIHLRVEDLKCIEASLDTEICGKLAIICYRRTGDALLFFV